RALALFLDMEKARPLYADPFVGNTGSVRLLERFGFKPTGPVWSGENDPALLGLDPTYAPGAASAGLTPDGSPSRRPGRAISSSAPSPSSTRSASSQPPPTRLAPPHTATTT